MDAHELFNEKHTAGIIDTLRVAGGGMRKTDLYDKVSTSPRMVDKIGILEDAGVVKVTTNGHEKIVRLTYKGEKIAALIECIDKVLDSDGVIC